MSDAFITAVRRRLHPDQQIPSPERPVTTTRHSKKRSTCDADNEDQSNSLRNIEQAQSIDGAPPELATQDKAPSNSRKRCARESNLDSADKDGRKQQRSKTVSATGERGARYRSHPSKAVLDRYQRSLRHRLYLIERGDGANTSEAAFAVMGANGNVYRCKVGTEPTCNCPDFTKRAGGHGHGPCKHLIFVFVRVLKVSRDDAVWWQTRLLHDEVSQVLRDAPAQVSNDCVADGAVRSMYRTMNSGNSERISGEGSEASVAANRKPIEGDCPVCFENMVDADETRPQDVTSFCESCGNNFHKVCVQNWTAAHGNPTCPLCRGDLSKQAPLQRQESEYVNLAAFSSQHARQMTLAELYADTHRYIGRQNRRSRTDGTGIR